MGDIDNYFENGQYADEREKLFYAIMYRQWENVDEIIENNNWSWIDIRDSKYRGNPKITIKKCFEYNLDFLKSVKNKLIYEKICSRLGADFKKVNNSNEVNTYDDRRFFENKSVIDVFWDGKQPVLSLKYYEKQTMAARQVMRNHASIVLDEVGTGKTVAGIFTIQQVIQERVDELKDNAQMDQVAILIVCPYNKREDWHSDILRQLGRESVVIDKSDNGRILLQKSYRKGIPHIYISGNEGGSDKSDQQLKESFYEYHNKPWDLVIIDECHNCFKNYYGIQCKRILLLTATPIVVSESGILSWINYESLMRSVLRAYFEDTGRCFRNTIEINPIRKQIVSEDDVFVCNFKEDIFNNIKIERQIRFVECARDPRRQEWFEKIRSKKDFFSAIFSDQDDQVLADKMGEVFPDRIYSIEKNYKLEELVKIILGKDMYEEYREDSILIFCETKAVVNLIYDKISGYASDELMIGKLHSKAPEIKNKQTNKDIIIPMLRNNIRCGKRSILVTTGKSSGTGLNLGEFKTVIHYELPFSSNAIEQRFGRIERAEDLIGEEPHDGERKTIKNKMVFMINKAVDGQMDFDTNRMLYYAINKINVTVQYMPIRNTVLFHPEYMKRVKEQAKGVWAEIIEALGQEDIKMKINDFFAYENECDKIRQMINSLKDEKEKEQFEGKDIKNSVKILLDKIAKENIGSSIETIQSFNKTYIEEFAEKNIEEIESFGKKVTVYIEYYLWLWNTLSFWGKHDDFNINKLWSLEETRAAEDKKKKNEEEENENTFVNDSKNFNDSLRKIFEKLKNEKDVDRRYSLITKTAEDVQKILEEVRTDDNFYSGVFYYEDGKMQNKIFE